MSTNSECDFIEIAPGKWYYVLEDYDAPKNSFDWREHASCFGPFRTEEAADAHLRDNHANPGGSCSCPYEDGYKMDEVMEKLVKSAIIGVGPGDLSYFFPGF
jgi:hypothetical protein